MSIFNSDLPIEDISSILKDVKSEIYFIGILGSGMYPLAQLLSGRGYKVSGSDRNAPKRPCVDGHGIFISRGDGTIRGAGLAVYSLAIDEGDAEILLARSLGIPLISRAQLLGALMRDYPESVSVSGSHGKSTVTALIDHILSVSGKPHTTVSGATLSSGERFTDGGEIFIAEACEYKNSFLRLAPTYQLITSVELDHTDYFATVDDVRASFLLAAKRAPCTIINIDDELASGICRELKALADNSADVITYGYSADADYRISDARRMGEITFFEINTKDKCFRLATKLIGGFNLYNVAAAVSVADMLGVPISDIEEAISDFQSIERRLSLISRINGVPIYYDYAHHPSEISAVIDALKERHSSLTVIFRPHTYSRTKSLWNEFITALSKANFTILLDIYPARENYIDGVSSKELAKSIKNCICANPLCAAELAVSYHTDAIALLGAGEVDGVKSDLLKLGKTKE